MRIQALLLLVLSSIGCVTSRDSADIASKWKLRARVEFVENNFKTARAALAQERFYLAFPFIGGDLYGVPTTDDFVRVRVNPDYSFVLDLSVSAPFAQRAAQSAAIGKGRVHGSPTALGLARVAAFTMDTETDQRVGSTAWVDASSDAHLVLAYFDRPGHIIGTLTEGGHELRFNISVDQKGYAWLKRTKLTEGLSEMVISKSPTELVLRVAPLRH